MGGAFSIDPINNFYIKNTDFYLYNGDWYWTMTPFAAAGGFAGVDIVCSDGRLGDDDVSNPGGARPVVSLSSDAISGGKGTMNDPWIVG